MNGYQVKLSAIDFEGPLDLLLHLIRKNEISIYDIPIVFILREYLLYLQALREIDIQVTSEFLAMASKLMFIKSKMLLPSQLLDEDPDDPWFKQFDDPRSELVRQLELRARLLAIRGAIEDLRGRELQAMYTFRRGADPTETFPPSPGAEFGEIALTDLLSYYEKSVARAKERAPIDVKLEPGNVKDMIMELLGRLKKGVKTVFNMLIGNRPTRGKVITSFLAILEMFKEGHVNLHQSGYNSPIEVEKI